MKQSTAQPVTLSFALWATASISHAQQLQPMADNSADQTLRPMNTPTDDLGTLRPMVETAADITATLTPMVSLSQSPTLYLQPPLVAMEKKAEPKLESPLVAMAQPVSTSTDPLRPMVDKPSTTDVVLTPLQRRGASELMRSSNSLRGAGIVDPLPGLEPLAPPLQVTPTKVKPIILKKNGVIPGPRPVEAVNGNVSTAADDTFPTNPLNLTDAELSPNPNIPTINRGDEELLAVDVLVNGIPRRGLIELYQDDKGHIWLPLTSVARLLEIPLSINAAAGVAQGWYQKPDNTFMLSMAQNRLKLGPQVFELDGQVEKHTTDLYLTSGALKQWLGVDSSLDYGQLQIRFTTPAPLPGDVRAARENKWDIAEKARAAAAIPSDTLIPGYSNFSLPIVRLGINGNYVESANKDAATSTGLTIQAQNDVLGMNSNLSLAFNQYSDGTKGLSGGSLLLQKQSDAADLLGPLKATYFGIGDITANPLVLSGLANNGRGVRVNNAPRGAVNDPDQYVLTGPAPINWDVEVYQNQGLVGFSRIDASGTYRFTALPLRAGSNQFRIVLYGPNGEREERRETIYLGDNIPSPGTVQYDAAVYQPNHGMIPGTNNSLISSSAVITQAQLTTGLTNKWAATVGAFQAVGDQQMNNGITPPEQGATAGLRGSMNGTYFTADVLGSTSGRSIQSSLRTPLTDALDLRLTQTRNYGYLADDRDELVTTGAEVTYPLTLGKTALDTTYGFTHNTYQTQQPKNTFNQRTSVGIGGVNTTNNLEYVTQGNASLVQGKLEATTRMMNTSVRAGLSYQPDSPDPLRDFSINTQIPVFNNQTLNLTYNQQLVNDKNSSVVTSINWPTGPWVVGLQGQAGSNGNASMGLNLATALVPQGDQARWKLAPPGASLGLGRAGVRVFIDENGNGVFDATETVLPNVTVYNRLRGTQAVTNAEGIARFSDLSPNALVRLSVEPTTLPDIYLKPVSDTLNVKPHTGDNGMLNYAVKMFGEVSGQARTPSSQPIQNLKVVIYNEHGADVDSYLTEFDGFYTFGALPMGNYTIKTEGAGAPLPVNVTLSPKSRIQTRNLTVTP